MYAGPVSKRDRLAGWLAASGLLRLAEYLPQRECLVVVNYHRVGDREATPYDPGVYSATPELFEEQIRFLRRRLRPVTLEEAAAFLAGRLRLGRAGVLVTFDDGYLDNYTTAFPLLRRHGVPAVFFLPTAFIGTGRLAWWDAIAYLVKHGPPRFAVEYPAPAAFDVAAEGL